MSEARLSVIRNEGLSTGLDARPPFPAELGRKESVPATVDDLTHEVMGLRRQMSDMVAVLLAMRQDVERLSRAQADMRVSRSQEATLRRAIRERAGDLAQREALPERAIRAAIQATLRELTGCRAIGDTPCRLYETTMRTILSWDMPGALRRIRRGL